MEMVKLMSIKFQCKEKITSRTVSFEKTDLSQTNKSNGISCKKNQTRRGKAWNKCFIIIQRENSLRISNLMLFFMVSKLQKFYKNYRTRCVVKKMGFFLSSFPILLHSRNSESTVILILIIALINCCRCINLTALKSFFDS